MATDNDAKLETLLEQIAIREKAARRRSIALTVLPIIGALVLLSYTAWRVQVATKRIAELRQEESALRNQLEEKRERLAELEKELSRKEEQLQASSTLLTETTLGASPQQQEQKQIIQRELVAAGVEHVGILDIRDQRQGYIVVLGSYRKIEDAVKRVMAFRENISREVKLYYAINDYYAAALGIFESRDEAIKTMRAVRSKISDAYIFSSAAFPYEIELKDS
jgi:hypothetical protein